MPFKSDKQRQWMHKNLPDIAEKWEDKYEDGGKVAQVGGMLDGPPHAQGGIPIEAEGGEFIIRKDSINESTLPALQYINETGELPIFDAPHRRNKRR